MALGGCRGTEGPIQYEVWSPLGIERRGGWKFASSSEGGQRNNEEALQKVVGWTKACLWKVKSRRASSTLIPGPYFALSFSISA